MAWTRGFPGFFPLGRLLPAAVAAACSAAWTPCLRCHRLQLGDLLDQAVRAARPCSARARSCARNRGAGAVTGRYIPRDGCRWGKVAPCWSPLPPLPATAW